MRRILPLLAVSTLALLPASAPAGFKTAEKSETPERAEGPLAPDLKLVSAEFGLVKKGEDDEAELVPSKTVPLVPGISFGWRLRFDTQREKLNVREELILPAAPKEWSGDPDNPAFKVSPDGKTATTEAKVELNDDGIVQNVWSVGEGDPAGDYQIRIFIDGKLIHTFKFKVEVMK